MDIQFIINEEVNFLKSTMMMGGGGSGSGDNETLNRMNLMSSLQMNPATISSSGDIITTTTTGMSSMKKDDRVPQWSHQETKDFISIRAELERDFTVAKRNKTLWEIVSTKMKERGYRRTPDQCKCKWKNLVNRYKGKETSDPENGRQCPFFDELHAVFTERAKNMHRLLIETEAARGGNVQGKKKMKRVSGDRSSEEFSDEEDDDGIGEDDSEDEKHVKSRKRKAGKVQKNTAASTVDKAGTTTNSNSGIQEMLREFFQQQHGIEMEWREMVERRALERRMFEQEWRQSMEKLERERLMVEQAWREREEQRRMREESRAEKRDALLTTLLNKLIREDHHDL